MSESLPEETRREIFLNLVREQDAGMGVEQSRLQVAADYNVRVASLQSIEREGIQQKWPPLSDDGQPE
jgi:hypothetical protein